MENTEIAQKIADNVKVGLTDEQKSKLKLIVALVDLGAITETEYKFIRRGLFSLWGDM